MGSKLQLDNAVLKEIRAKELAEFRRRTKKSQETFERSRTRMPGGVPQKWMVALWEGTEMFVAKGKGCHFEDLDGNSYLDMTLCDMSMTCGFGPEAVAKAVEKQFREGSHFLLPTENALEVCDLLFDRFKMQYWQFTLSASTANTEAIRISRAITGREKVLVFDGKYHGHIDETLVQNSPDGIVQSNLGPARDTVENTSIVPFNDVEALERALRSKEYACILAEPVMTNMGVIMPDDGFLQKLRDLTKETGTLMIIDETHSHVAHYGGFTRHWGLKPDILTLGKFLGGGVPIGAYALSQAVNDFVVAHSEPAVGDGPSLAIGGTMFGNSLGMASALAALTHVLTEENYARTQALGARLADGIDEALKRHGLPWRAHRLSNRSGICMSMELPRNSMESSRTMSPELNLAARAFMANRGVWEPFFIHGPAVSFSHTADDIDTYLAVFNQMLENVVLPAVKHTGALDRRMGAVAV